jgi:U2 small nuclear ribonucleoprotein B''
MAEPSPPPIQQPQPSLAPPPFEAPVVEGQTPVVEENPCETLYIQNLNEKVKPEGACLCLPAMVTHG